MAARRRRAAFFIALLAFSFRKNRNFAFLRNEKFFVAIGEKALCYLMFLSAMMTMRKKPFRKNRIFVFLRNEKFFVRIGEKALCYLMFLRAMMTMRKKSFRKNRNFTFLRNEVRPKAPLSAAMKRRPEGRRSFEM